jgi:hypothetical protein
VTAAAVVEGAAPAARGKWMLWAGRVLSGLSSLMLVFSGSMKLSGNPQMVEQFEKTFGYPGSTLPIIGVIEIACVALYLIPRTAVLGAVLLTGYLGGAVATHVRIGDPFIAPILLGAAVWGGLFLRDPRIRALLPLRAASPSGAASARS